MSPPVGASRSTIISTRQPNSVIGNYDATKLSLSDGQSVSTWLDESPAGNDLTAGTAPTYSSSAINGQPAVIFDGSSTFLDVDFSLKTQPNTIMAVANHDVDDFSGVIAGSNQSNDKRHTLFSYDENGTGYWAIFANGDVVTGAINDESTALITGIFDGSDSEIRVNGASTGTGDPGPDGLNGLSLGINGSGTEHLNGEIGEVIVYNADLRATGFLASEEQRLADKWGIAI